MKIIIFVPTLDGKSTGNDNEYQEHCGYFNPGHMAGAGPHYIKHEIEVPNNAVRLRHYCIDGNGGMIGLVGDVFFPRPKVKKWRWGITLYNHLVTTNKHLSEDEACKLKACGWTKEYNTEVEE